MDTPQELIYKVYLSDYNNMVVRNIYTGQLEQLANRYNLSTPAFISQIKKSKYDQGELIAIAAKINGNSEQQIKSTLANQPGGRFFVGAAYAINTLTYSGSFNPFPNSSPAKSNMPTLTFGYDAVLNPNVGRLIFRGELGLSINDYATNGVDNSYNQLPQITTQKVKQFTLAVSPQIIYNIYNTFKLKFFLGGGVAFNFSSYPTNNFTSMPHADSNNNTPYPVLNSLWLSAPLKAGIVLNKKIEIYAAYSHSLNLDYYLQIAANITTYRAGINFLIGK